MSTGEAAAMALLARLGARWTLVEHEPVFTVRESAHVTAHLPGAHTKNLFLREKSGQLWLATCLAHRRVRIRDLERRIGAKGVSFASAEALRDALGVEPGSVTPLALVNDAPPRVRVVLDAQMLDMDPVNVHPLRNDATVAIDAQALRAFVAATGHDAVELDFDALEALAAEHARGRAAAG
ncbi:MAG: prolyl-tRNA synthetase associated domain-containing protein [Rubrimonas sp.]|uniref:prolyl-tRNA synthetase associated domain-containing protein n=1 Tax=Rubrimonas sp. TaxID=2036015 RepID=UPI002FDD5DFF